MSRRIYFKAWGPWVCHHDLPAYAMTDPDNFESDASQVATAIARRVGLSVITLRSDGSRLERGKIVADEYQMTLGRPCPGGGWTPEGELWFSVSR